MDEAAAVASGFQVRIFLCARHPDGPNLLPSLVQLHVDGVHARVVGGHSVPHVSGDAMLLQKESGEWVTVETPKSQTNPSPFPATNCLVFPLESNQGRAVPLQPLLSLTVSTKGSPGTAMLGGHPLPCFTQTILIPAFCCHPQNSHSQAVL